MQYKKENQTDIEKLPAMASGKLLLVLHHSSELLWVRGNGAKELESTSKV